MATQSAEEANEEIQKAVATKQWKKAEKASAKLQMALAASKRSTEMLDVLQAKKKKLANK